ncbi:succinate dehydrogenase, cytochrome b556 subunit [Candidatus Anaplasma sp. TIGMIC]|uniref:succinate dehydrogenase, cytochrome b556 subunit n=1 Tax=Candidatus Anaplasma sp. TIGMIC TaxID=3020713 RepID=UPI00232FB6B9|nr:succinate dehydrogenase, cytochrome b556 subunit [Candidatus Anaplasma sp. TIGMIC]MDB1135028.1 succinate dehydrogenase, cytochrome b556 subunit [Candidatus Anaplasma sp. TIGMIC]
MSRSRPLSPHLGVYRLPVTALLSISHRAAGVLLYLGLTFFSWLLVFLTFYPGVVRALLAYRVVEYVVEAGLFVWFGSLCYHYCNGIRHLFWDCGIGLGKKAATISGYVTLAVAVSLALGLFFIWY